MIGKTISHYKILEKLGEGGMGEVYIAEDVNLKRNVAIKFLPVHLTKDKENVERFKREAQAAAALNHPNIVTIYEIAEEDDQTFIVMEYVDGKSLREVINEYKLGFDKIIDIMNQISEGILQAHKADIIHRDLKPENIIVGRDGRVRILDFGLAKLKGVSKLTKEASTLGTIHYMSPEQLQGKEIDLRSDIWSLGVLLYEMLMGEPPFKGEYESAVHYAILNEEPQEIENIPVAFQKIIKNTLAKNPNERYHSTGELLEDLRAMCDQHKGIEKKVAISQKEKLKRKPVYLYAGIAIAIILISLMSIFFFPKQNRTIKSLAVLPFSNTKSDSEADFLGFALADQIIGDLTYIKSIIVRPSSSIRKYENQIVDPLTVYDDLRVDYILTGNYLIEANDIRLNIELVDVHSNEMIWRIPIAVKYENTFKLQDLVSEKIINGLRIQFSQEEQTRMQIDVPKDPLAYEYYLRSISYPHTNDGSLKAIEKLYQSVKLDSTFAPAFEELGYRTHLNSAYVIGYGKELKKAENFYLKALSLNDGLLRARTYLCFVYTETGRTEKAVEFAKQMWRINPNNAYAHFAFSYIYRYTGMLRESELEAEKAMQISPNNPDFRSAGETFVHIGNYQKAIEIFDFDKGSVYAPAHKGAALLRKGENDRALKYFNRVLEIEREGVFGFIVTAMKASIDGNTEEGLRAVRQLEQRPAYDGESFYDTASLYGLLGDKVACVRMLQKAVKGGFFNFPLMLKDPFLDKVRDDPGFQKVLLLAKAKHEAFKKKYFPEKYK